MEKATGVETGLNQSHPLSEADKAQVRGRFVHFAQETFCSLKFCLVALLGNRSCDFPLGQGPSEQGCGAHPAQVRGAVSLLGDTDQHSSPKPQFPASFYSPSTSRALQDLAPLALTGPWFVLGMEEEEPS